MMMRRSAATRIFIGEPVRYESELAVLRFVCDELAQQDTDAILLVNFNVDGAQIDLVVATETKTLLVEAKTYSHPVHGTRNGPWHLVGSWGRRPTRNAYNQALDAKNALRDSMQKLDPAVGYPDAMVCIPRGLPTGSTLPSPDFKLGIGALEALGARLASDDGCRWPTPLWEGLIADLGLQEAKDIQAATSPEIFAAQATLRRYQAGFLAFYDNGERYVADEYSHENQSMSFSDLSEMLARSENVLIRGPSGCGKSLVARKLAIAHLQRGGVSLFVSAKGFDGALGRTLDVEASLLDTDSAASLLRAARHADAPLLLVVDGFNECNEELAVPLMRSVAAFARRYGATVLLSAQRGLPRAELLNPAEVVVAAPSLAMKRLLASGDDSNALTTPDLTEQRTVLLEAISSGLEAVLVGHVGQILPQTASRAELYDTYVRTRLGDEASDGIRCLCALAKQLLTRASFRMSVRELDRLMHDVDVRGPVLRKLESTHLLARESNWVSFGHELFFAAFAAEVAIREHGDDQAGLLKILVSPRFLAARTFIVGAIEDQGPLQRVLADCRDDDIYEACFKGECGALAQQWVCERLSALFSKMTTEATQVTFELGDPGWHSAQMCEATLLFERDEVTPMLKAIAHGLMRGEFIESTLVAIRHLDAQIAFAIPTLIDKAKENKVPLRSSLFSHAYVMTGHAGISQLMRSVHSGVLTFGREHNARLRAELERAWACATSAGEFYFLINLTKYGGQASWAAPYVVPLAQRIKRLPYHLQLDVLDFANSLREVQEPWRTQLIEAFEASLDQLGVMMNSVIFDALRALGAMEEQEHAHEEVVRSEIQDALSADCEEADQRAYGIFSCQFDHPFESAYCEVFSELPQDEMRALLVKAARGAGESSTYFLDVLLRQLRNYTGDDVAAAVHRWTKLPPKDSFMPQNSMSVFVEAHTTLGAIGGALPIADGSAMSPIDEAVLACGELGYWATRASAGLTVQQESIDRARAVLLREESVVAAGALMVTISQLRDDDGSVNSLVNAHPDVALPVCRQALRQIARQEAYFEHSFMGTAHEITVFALQVIGHLGDQADIPRLREFCDVPALGSTALHSIRAIEDRQLGAIA